MTQATSTAARRPASIVKRTLRWTAVLALAAVGGTVGWFTYLHFRDQAVLALIASPNPGDRKRAADLSNEYRSNRLWLAIARELELGRETNETVRDWYVHALGNSGRAEYFSTLALLTVADPQPVVRAAAWRSLARVDPTKARDLARGAARPDDVWVRLGIAEALLECGDMSPVDDVIEIAVSGTDGQRLRACRTLSRTVLPLLEATGSVPLHAPREFEKAWPVEFVREIQHRISKVALQSISDETRPKALASAESRRDLRRITDARNRITNFLYPTTRRAAEP